MNEFEHLAQEVIGRCKDESAPIHLLAEPLLAASDAEICDVLSKLHDEIVAEGIPRDAKFWEALFGIFHAWQLRGHQEERQCISNALRTAICELYSALSETNSHRFRLLQWLTLSGGSDDISAFAETICDDPPTNSEAAALPFLPLMTKGSRASDLFPKAKQCLTNPLLAAPTIDVANFVFRNQDNSQHLLANERDLLIKLLSGITSELESLQESPNATESARDQAISGVALAVSLCDALALIGSDSALAALTHALGLRHRRVHIEAAAALTRLGDDDGKKALIHCATDPVTRLRALQYAEELDLEEEVDDLYTSGAALAEAELYSYLMQPSVMGVPPTACELIDDQTMYWPGYDEPRQCYLFRFTYSAIVNDQQVSFSNIGIAGPVVHTFKADLGNLPADDIYAAYAGWQAEHPEITQASVGQAIGFGGAVEELTEHIESQGYQRVQPVLSGRFFGDEVVAAAAERNGIPGAAVSDGDALLWYPAEGTSRPITPAEAYCIYKGRRLLRQFN